MAEAAVFRASPRRTASGPGPGGLLRFRRFSNAGRFLFLAVGSLFSRPVDAQDPTARENESPSSEPTPSTEKTSSFLPQVKDSVEPLFPERARDAGVTESSVTLKVLVDVDGRVQKAEIVESAGYGFDEAAKEAALQYVFEPAIVAGKPTAAFVLLRIDFQAPPASPPTPAGAPPESPFPVANEAPRAFESGAQSSLPEVASEFTPANALDQEVEVTVRGHSEAERLRRSAEAVHVLETKELKRNSQDLGEVLARTQGVGVQRSSGLGSDTRISLNGMTDDQIRFFLDGIPMDFMGYPFGIANVPVNLVDRIEVYRGVVPIRFGADALGGAINLVSDRNLESGLHGAASFQAGSFGTYRATVNGHHFDERRGWLTRVGAFLDLADNDYPMNIEVPDAFGQERPARVYRFHDGYQARGLNIETGVVNKEWAKRLSLRAFLTEYDKDVQHNLFMTFNPYGDVKYGQTTYGAVARYENVLLKQLALSVVAGYAYEHSSYLDVGECVYNWFAQCIRPRGQPGERIGRAQDQDFFEHNVYGRVNLAWFIQPGHSFRLSVSPTYTERTGTEHRLANPAARDPLSAERKLGGLVTGVEYEAELFEDRLVNQLFFKDYIQALWSEDPLSNGIDFRREDRATHRVGVGNSLRYNLLEWLYAKASYEWATRLPRPDEIFGNVFPVVPNLYLRPETSHNLNFGGTVDSVHSPIGKFRADVNGFVREASDLIRIVGDDESASYQNVRNARSLGAETALGWTSVGEYLAVDGNATYVDFRNTSTEGPDAAYEGDRIPNRPYFFATGSARLQLSQIAASRDQLSLTWTSRYVHSFFRGWESIGMSKSLIPEQTLHSLVLTYFVQGDDSALSFSGELQNLTDAHAYDYFGVPKPGRAFYFKVTASR